MQRTAGRDEAGAVERTHDGRAGDVCIRREAINKTPWFISTFTYGNQTRPFEAPIDTSNNPRNKNRLLTQTTSLQLHNAANMKCSAVVAAAALLISSAVATPLIKREGLFESDAAIVKQAALAWQANTRAVSDFLDAAAAILSVEQEGVTVDLRGLAVTALDHEINELQQKGDLEDQACVVDTNCQNTVQGFESLLGAKTQLESGTFQSVVDQLTLLSGDAGTDFDAIRTSVDIINNGPNGRCQGVLPAIDQYFSVASDALSDDSLFGVRAIRPNACT
ncbi:hypothetical protein LTR10_005430 [Elasticomyces elasticus]|nr:hypothetical protein LTR10_005430 [Elasticomyces elasticus]KAK4976169.1 hypothetical protein LTR42_003794 [Elasticomyces elasticus]